MKKTPPKVTKPELKSALNKFAKQDKKEDEKEFVKKGRKK